MEATLKIIIEPSSEFLAALWSISAATLGQKPAVPASAATVLPAQTLASPAAVISQVSTPASAAITPAVQPPAPAAPMAPIPTAVPVAVPVPMPTPAAVPVASIPGYTLEQLGKAGAALVDAGKRDQLIALLNNRGVQALNQLDPAQYGAFATELRGLGAQI